MAPLCPALPHPPMPAGGPAKAAPPPRPPVDADIRVCLDFIKGRCGRTRCKFHHPEMGRYQQLSGVVQAQAGKQICEVWAMAGTCKFGAKCNKLHPVVIAPAAQSMLAMPVPVPLPVPVHIQLPAPSPPGPASLPTTSVTPTPTQTPVPYGFATTQSPSSPTKAPVPAASSARLLPPTPSTPLYPQHVTMKSDLEEEAEFQDLAQSILKALEVDWEQPRPLFPASKASPGIHCSPAPQPVSTLDRALLEVLCGLDLTGC